MKNSRQASALPVPVPSRPRPISAAIAACFAYASCAAASDKVGAALGAEFRVNTETLLNQAQPSGASSADGDFVIAWQSIQDGSGYGVFAQRYDSAGRQLGGEFQVNEYESGAQEAVEVAMAADGRFIVVWQSGGDGSGRGIFGRLYDENGSPVGGQFQVNSISSAHQLSPRVAMDADGDFVVTWSSYATELGDPNLGVHARRFSSAGIALAPEFRVNTFTAGRQVPGSVAITPAGSFIVTWTSIDGQDGDQSGVFGQRFDVAGNPQGIEFQVNSITSGSQSGPRVAADANGNFAVVWYGPDTSIGYDVFIRSFSSTGAPLGPDELVNVETRVSHDPDLAMDAHGNHVVVWNSDVQANYDVYAQLFGADGTRLRGPFRINQYLPAPQRVPSVSMDADGDFTVAWQSRGQEDPNSLRYNVYARRYSGPENVDLSLDLDDLIDPADRGDGIGYTLTVTNQHLVETPTGFPEIDSAIGSARKVRVTQTFPADVAAIASAKGSGWACNRNLPTLTCNFGGDLGAGDSATITVRTGSFPASGGASSVDSTATIRADQYDADAADNSATETTALTCGSGEFSFSRNFFVAHEDVGSKLITVNRSGGSCGTAGVSFATSAGTATSGADYVDTSGALGFGHGVTSRQFPVTILDQPAVEETESVGLDLSAPTGGATIGVGQVTLHILDDDGP